MHWTLRKKLAWRLVRRMHIIAGHILDTADVIENRIVIPDE